MSDKSNASNGRPIPRMTQRPKHLDAPVHLSPSPPLPKPAPPSKAKPDGERDATRYGDWELKGIAVDF